MRAVLLRSNVIRFTNVFFMPKHQYFCFVQLNFFPPCLCSFIHCFWFFVVSIYITSRHGTKQRARERKNRNRHALNNKNQVEEFDREMNSFYNFKLSVLLACAVHTHTDSHKSKRKLQVYVQCTVATAHSFIWRIYIKMTLYVIVLSCLHPTPQRPLYIRTGTPCSHFRERCRRRTRRKVSFSLVRGKICAMSV